MSLKSNIGMLGMMSLALAMGGQGMSGPRYAPSPRKNKARRAMPILDSIINPVIPKGHKTQVIIYTFATPTFTASIDLVITGGSTKSLIKKRYSIGKQLEEYVARTPKDALLEFGQFQINDVEPIAEKTIETSKGKGDYEGICNRTACKTMLPALYYNHSTQLHYCRTCAELINSENQADAIRLYGHALCTLV